MLVYRKDVYDDDQLLVLKMEEVTVQMKMRT